MQTFPDPSSGTGRSGWGEPALWIKILAVGALTTAIAAFLELASGAEGGTQETGDRHPWGVRSCEFGCNPSHRPSTPTSQRSEATIDTAPARFERALFDRFGRTRA
jgi:hypothetical protein